MIKKLFTHTAIYGLAPQIPKIAGIFALPITTRYLTELDFGVYGVITAVTGGISVLGTLGLNVILTNAYFKSPGQYKWAWRQIYGFLMLWNFPFAILSAVVIYFFIPKEAASQTLNIILLNVTPIVFFGPTSILGSLYYQLKQQPTSIAVRAVIFGLMTVALNIIFIAHFRMGYMGWFLSICISNILSQASYWYPLNVKLNMKPIFNFKIKYLKNALRISLPTVPHYYAGYLLNTSDRMVMRGLNIPTLDIGLYNAAYTIGNLIQQVGVAAGKAISPMLNKAFKENKQLEARHLIFVLQIAFLSMTFLLAIWMKEVFVVLIKNKALQRVYPLSIVIIMAYTYRPMYFGANNTLFFLEKTKSLLKITLVAGLGNLILNLIFIPIFGYQAAAYTTFVALMYMGYSGYFFKAFTEDNRVNYYPLLWLALTLVLTALAMGIVELHWTIKCIISAGVAVATVIGFRLCQNSTAKNGKQI